MIDQTGHESGSMDILYLLERLEEALTGPRIPMTNKTLVDDEECLAIIDQIRLSLPNEIRQARKVNSEREAVIGEAQARADQLLRSAEADSRERAKDHHIVHEAQAQADQMLAQAHRQADEIRREADAYAYRVFQDLDRRLEGLAAAVQQGLQALQPERDPGDGSFDAGPPQR
jgi:cell division septum initiation protein DivIVA